MTGWLIFVGYLAGWAIGARLALGMLMAREVCSKGTSFAEICRQYDGSNCRRPVGELRARTLADGLLALAIGLPWPVLVVAHVLTASTPATPGEARRRLVDQERRITEQAADIERLNRMIKGEH
jgi:hypothetical protein